MKKSKCPVCDSYDTYQWYKADANVKKLSFTYEFSPSAKKTFRVVRCNNCSHVFCDPLPKDMYRYYEDVVDEKYLTQRDDRLATAKKIVSEISKYKRKGKVLDIGCATGDFLEVAKKKGFLVYGLELSKWSVKIARDKGLTVFRESIKTHAKKHQGQYDIVTLWGVIEHFEKPKEELEYINKLLKPSGIIVLWTGDVDSITSYVMGRNWWYWLGQHIQYFTRRSLYLLGKQTGFTQVFSKTYPQAATYVRLENSMARYKKKRLILLFFRLVFSIRPTWILYLPGEIFWMAKKTNTKKEK